MKANIEIKDNKVYLVRFFFFKTPIGRYSDGMLIFDKPFQKVLEKDNNGNVNILRKTF